MEHFLCRTDAYVDLHSGDGYEELTPYVYYVGGTGAGSGPGDRKGSGPVGDRSS